MCAPYAKEPVTLKLVGGRPISQPYIDMTTAMMASFGIEVIKSEKEEHTYHIPQGNYHNPREYVVESDASSATYPLAVAAMTGSSCTIPNIGSKSLQGDAGFAANLLKPMGCSVEQTDDSTTVTGPPVGTLKPLSGIDMETMTDAFLTASVLAAVAQGDGTDHTTRITGIANQRVKECNRIQAMRTQLSKFGVTCQELDDGIEVQGLSIKTLKTPQDGVYCYDDHRVAMSLSVLALVAPGPVLIQEKDCTAKTWPGWWDTLSQLFRVSLQGREVQHSHTNGINQASKRSVFIIGMRGAGKTTMGGWASKSLGWPLIDLDTELERTEDKTIPQLIEEGGWEGFRAKELALLQKSMKEKPFGYVFACGGGIVELEEARQLLSNYQKDNGIVLLIHRNIEEVTAFLNIDKIRTAYVEDMMAVWLRRKPWYDQCSNFQFYTQDLNETAMSKASDGFSRFLATIQGKDAWYDLLKSKRHSFFVSLTIPDIKPAIRSLREAVVGADAVELRVDLLKDPNAHDGIPSVQFVTEQVALLRCAISVPMIFTIRTLGQGGKFPDHAYTEALELYQLALRMGIEFVDLEIQFPERVLTAVAEKKGGSKIIASHHDPLGRLAWNDGSWIPHYNKALQYGDVIKLVGSASSIEDNYELARFKSWAERERDVPMIAINMGTKGKLSRIMNFFLTPVSHPALPLKAAPGQLSAAEIRGGLSLMGEIEPKNFYLFGKPIAASRSPALHNTLFRKTGLPHQYGLFETDQVEDLKGIMEAEDFGGASVTIPLKLDIMKMLHDVTDEAKIIGAVNTIIPTEYTDATRRSLVGDNTDWQGMIHSLRNAGAKDDTSGESSLVIGGGGTARAAIFAMHSMGYSPVYLINRSPQKLDTLIASFPRDYDLRKLSSIDDVDQLKRAPSVAVGTIPADQPIEQNMREVLVRLLEFPAQGEQAQRTLLEMAYKPRVTALMQLAQDAGWVTIPGLEVLTGQGLYQVWASDSFL